MALVVLLLCPGTSREIPSKVRSGLMVALVGGHGWKYLQQHQKYASRQAERQIA